MSKSTDTGNQGDIVDEIFGTLVKSRFIELIDKEECEEKTLDELTEKWFKGQSLKKEDLSEDGKTYCIHYGELFTKYGPIIDEVVSKTNIVSSKQSENGDILFPASDVTPNGLARCSAIIKSGVILGGDIIVLRPKSGINQCFLSYAINNEKQQILSRVTGALVKHLSAKSIGNVVVKIPKIEYQNEFIEFVKQVDKSKFIMKQMISKYDELVKSRFIEMFGTEENPKVPFYPLGEIASFVNGYAFKPSDWGTEGLPIVRIQNLSGTGEKFNYYLGEYPKEIELNNGDIVISWSATIGVFLWAGPKALLNQHIFKVYFDKMEVDPTFFRIAVDTPLKRGITKVHGSTMTHLTKKTFESIKAPLPNIEQQKLFAEFVSQVDKSKFELIQCVKRIKNQNNEVQIAL